LRGIRAGCRIPVLLGPNEASFVPFPYMLAYGAAALECRPGVSVRMLDGIAEDLDDEEFDRRVAALRPDLIVNEIGTGSWEVDVAAATRLKARTGARVVACGPHASALPEEVLSEPCFDYVILGELDETLPELVDALVGERPLGGLAGLAYRDAAGRVVVEQRRPLVRDLDSLPHPHRDDLPMHAYRVAGLPTPTLFMHASRGCPYRCTYCLWPQTVYEPGRFRARSPEAVVDEICYARERYGPFKAIYFDDDTFNIGKRRMLALADALQDRCVDLPFSCNARPDRFDEETLERLAAAGLVAFRIGVESGDPAILERARKDLDLASVHRCVQAAHRVGIKVHMCLTIGLSGESAESIERTIAFARSAGTDSVSFSITTPYPGTAYYDEVVSKGYLETRRWADFNVVRSSVIRTEHLSRDELTRAEKRAMRKVYSSPAFMARRLRYAMSGADLLALVKKGVKLAAGLY